METRHPDAGSATPWLDVAHLEHVCDGDEGLDLDLLLAFLEHAGGQLVELESCIAARDIASMHRLAHSLTGSALAVGATALAEACRGIEHAPAAPSDVEVIAFRAVRERTIEAVSLRLDRAA